MSTFVLVEDLRYPIGRFVFDANAGPEKRAACIADIAALPAEIRRAVSDLSDWQLDTPCRDGGWTLRQLVHHLADSHMNAFIRCKLALTEKEPRIAAYDQDAWAAMPDVTGQDIRSSLSLLDGLHARWSALLSSLAPGDFQRTFNHPEHGLQTVDRLVQTYAWHCRHHVAHIDSLKKRKGWKQLLS